MARKKVVSKEVKPEKVGELSFFKCNDLIHEIETLAADQDGELTDEQMATLVEAHTAVPAKLMSLCNFLKMLEAFVKVCKDRKAEINTTQKRNEGVRERLAAYLAVWVKNQGKSYHCGDYELKTRDSTSVKLIDGFDDPLFCSIEEVTVVTPDKKRIKEALLASEEVPGAELVHKTNLSIK